jgi:hypothetical protein
LVAAETDRAGLVQVDPLVADLMRRCGAAAGAAEERGAGGGASAEESDEQQSGASGQPKIC